MKKIVISLFLFLLVIPAVVAVFKFPFGVRLKGIAYNDEKPIFDYKDIGLGKTQNAIESNLKQYNNLYPVLIKTERQINFWLFGQAGLGYKSNIVIGNNNQLIEKVYLNSYNAHRTITPRSVQQRVKIIERISSFFAKRGISVFNVVTPNKPEFYPQVVPSSYAVPPEKRKPNFYSMAKEIIPPTNQNFILLPELFRANEYPVFSSGGTHLNEYGSCLAAQKIIDRINSYKKHRIPALECKLGSKHVDPFYLDIDLAELLNIWTPEVIFSDGPRTLHKPLVLKDTEYDKPKVLIIGTSFVWGIKRFFTENRYFPTVDFIYYFLCT
jgi:hypothetical protein